MLYALGAVVFETAPLNVDQADRTTGADFAEKPVLGRRAPLEPVGEAAEEVTFQGKLFPAAQGGLDEMDALHEMRQAAAPQHLIRGDGKPMGWFVITAMREGSRYLDARGVGQVIEFEVSLRRADKPAAGDYQSEQQGLVA